MKSALSIIIAALCSYSSIAQGRVEAHITNLRSDKGVCRVCMFNSASSFTGEAGNPFECSFVPLKNKVADAVFTNVPQGKYAIMVFHDENNNGKLDKNFLGMPKEGYGASNNKLPFAAAPTYANSSFDVLPGSTISLGIKIRNL